MATDRARGNRVAERLYAALGPRVVLVCVAAGLTLVAVSCVVGGVALGRYLEWSASHELTLSAVFGPVILALIVASLWRRRDRLRPILQWPEGDAGAAWRAIGDLPRLWARCAAPGVLGIVVGFVYLLVAHDFAAWAFVPSLTVAMVLGPAAGWMLLVLITEVLMRPMLTDVSRHLSSELPLPGRGLRLRTKVMLPLPIVAVVGMLVVGAYANATTNGALRLTITIGVTAVAIGLAMVILELVGRPLLDPVDELVAATERVGAGDLDTPVPVTSTDELATLAQSFNRMLAGLREREALRDELRASRTRIVAASDAERRRVERNMHDGAQQELIGLAVQLRVLEERMGPTEFTPALVALRAQLDSALNNVRELARGLHPAVLTTDGLRPALEQLAARSAVPATVRAADARFPEPVEATAYFIASEALANAARHADASRIDINLQRGNGSLIIAVTDDGVGGADPAGGSGLAGLADRVAALEGVLRVESPAGGGTSVTAELPLP